MAGINEEDLKKNVKNVNTWVRLVFLIVFAAIFYLCSLLSFAASVLQFFTTLFTGAPIKALAEFGDDLAAYLAQVIRFLTFASDEKPFPFAPWPKSKISVINREPL